MSNTLYKMELVDDLADKERHMQWTSLAISHVEYQTGDWLGKFLALTSLCPLALVIAFVTLILFRRDLHTITFLCGTALNEAINWILKHLIKELRPCRGREILYSEYGMPSNHAQFMWFFATYMAFFLLIRLHHGNSTYPLENAWKYIVTVFIICVAAIVSYSRPISEFLMLRDTTLIPNVMWFEYTSHRTESRTRQRKLVSMKSQ
ncbi:dolichyldiphosphatase 1-like isoform X2 [Stegodyphus dumicola]|uniref:dolichyldiphosphatase 1-like isoform X2 n=1 Tax=Stegodyphus dumicola TaxID=202533 RepID=UPI0015AC2DAE|nr:dolichyldiphosphatase 1-like isoform X2 [Stegodyphus dumicola]